MGPCRCQCGCEDCSKYRGDRVTAERDAALARVKELEGAWKAAELHVHPAIVEAERQRDESRQSNKELHARIAELEGAPGECANPSTQDCSIARAVLEGKKT